MQVVSLTVICALFYAMFEVFAGLAGGKVNQWLAAVLYNGIGTVIPLIIYLASTVKQGKTTIKGIIYAGLAGVAIMLFSVLLARIFNKGGNLAFVIPAIYGIAIILSSIFGWIFLKEKVSGLQVAGIALMTVGVICVIVAKLRYTA